MAKCGRRKKPANDLISRRPNPSWQSRDGCDIRTDDAILRPSSAGRFSVNDCGGALPAPWWRRLPVIRVTGDAR